MYYTILIPYEHDTAKRTAWHPTEATGPFATLMRGAFDTRTEAHEWARKRLGYDAAYSVVRVN